jgi:hypothetical protein
MKINRASMNWKCNVCGLVIDADTNTLHLPVLAHIHFEARRLEKLGIELGHRNYGQTSLRYGNNDWNYRDDFQLKNGKARLTCEHMKDGTGNRFCHISNFVQYCEYKNCPLKIYPRPVIVKTKEAAHES